MNPRQLKFLFAACAVALALTGCTVFEPQGFDKAARLSDALQSLKQELITARTEMGALNESLRGLSGDGIEDPRAWYRQFTNEISSIKRRSGAVERKADAVASRSDAYFGGWETELQEIQNQALRERSAERRSFLMREYARVTDSLENVRQAYRPVLSDLEDLKRVFSQDLTPAGRAAIVDLSVQVRENAQWFNTRVDESVGTIDDMTASLATTGAGD